MLRLRDTDIATMGEATPGRHPLPHQLPRAAIKAPLPHHPSRDPPSPARNKNLSTRRAFSNLFLLLHIYEQRKKSTFGTLYRSVRGGIYDAQDH